VRAKARQEEPKKTTVSTAGFRAEPASAQAVSRY
jgi:hypothetical protein